MKLHLEDAMKKKGAKMEKYNSTKKAPNDVKSPESIMQTLWDDLDE